MGGTWPGGHHDGLFQMLTWEQGGDGYVYVFSTGFQRDKGLILQRVPPDRLADPAAWEGWGYRDGTWAWGNPPTVTQAPRETLVHGSSWDSENHAEGRVAQLYGGYLIPGSTLDDLHLIVSRWNTATNWPYRAMQFHANVAGLAADRPSGPRSSTA